MTTPESAPKLPDADSGVAEVLDLHLEWLRKGCTGWTCLQISAQRSHCAGDLSVSLNASCTMLAIRCPGRLLQLAAMG